MQRGRNNSHFIDVKEMQSTFPSTYLSNTFWNQDPKPNLNVPDACILSQFTATACAIWVNVENIFHILLLRSLCTSQ